MTEEGRPGRLDVVRSTCRAAAYLNNHVERTNRMFRFLEKVRYKWRRRKTLVRFVVLKLDDVWRNWEPPKAKGSDHTTRTQTGKAQAQARQTTKQVA